MGEYGQQVFVSQETRDEMGDSLAAFLIGATEARARRDGYTPIAGTGVVSWPDDPFQIASDVSVAVIRIEYEDG